MKSVMLVAVVGVLLGGNLAAAACKDDIKAFDSKMAIHPKQGDQKTVQKELTKARDLSTWDEVGCFNALTRAKRAYVLQAPEDANADKSVKPVQPLNQQ